MLRRIEVRGGVFARRVVTAADMPALLAEPEVQPIATTGGKAVLAAIGLDVGRSEVGREVATFDGHGDSPCGARQFGEALMVTVPR